MAVAIVLLVIVVIVKTAVIVPQQSAYVIERLGRYSRTLQAGFHILLPFLDTVAYKHTLKEQAVDISEQLCITRDNVQVGVDGVLYLQVLEPRQASYGITNYIFAISQLAQTTLRSEVGKIDLDRTFEERSSINRLIVNELDQASAPWGVKVLRYEIRNINPPTDVLNAMEKQMRAEAGKARRGPEFGGRTRRQDQRGGRRKTARDQGIGSHAHPTNQRSPGRSRGDPGRGDGHGGGDYADRPVGERRRRYGRHAAARGRAVHRAVRPDRQGRQHAGGARQPERPVVHAGAGVDDREERRYAGTRKLADPDSSIQLLASPGDDRDQLVAGRELLSPPCPAVVSDSRALAVACASKPP